MSYEIMEIEQDIAGKYRAIVDLSNEESIMLKFQDEPTYEEIMYEVDRFITNRIREQKENEPANEG